MDEPRLQHRVDDATQNEMLAYVLEHALDAGQASVKRGPELLPILRDAGVVDAGGYGLTIIFAGVIAALRGAEPPPLEHYAPARITQPAARLLDLPLLHELRGHRRGPRARALDRAARAHRRLRARGRRRAHAEGPRPHRRARAGHRPLRRRRRASRGSTSPTCTSRSSSAPSACASRSTPAACSPSSTATACARSSRAWARRSLDGGATLNPSTYELLAGIHEVPAEEVVVLRTRRTSAWPPSAPRSSPRSPSASCRPARWPPGSPPRWRSTPPTTPRRNAAAMEETLQRVRTGGVTEAARDDTAGPLPPRRLGRASSTRSSSPGASRARRSRSCSASSAARPSS